MIMCHSSSHLMSAWAPTGGRARSWKHTVWCTVQCPTAKRAVGVTTALKYRNLAAIDTFWLQSAARFACIKAFRAFFFSSDSPRYLPTRPKRQPAPSIGARAVEYSLRRWPRAAERRAGHCLLHGYGQDAPPPAQRAVQPAGLGTHERAQGLAPDPGRQHSNGRPLLSRARRSMTKRCGPPRASIARDMSPACAARPLEAPLRPSQRCMVAAAPYESAMKPRAALTFSPHVRCVFILTTDRRRLFQVRVSLGVKRRCGACQGLVLSQSK